MALGDIAPQYIHRKHGKLYYNVAEDIALNEDLILDSNGVPDAVQNPLAVYIGATDAGYEFSAEPTIYEELVDEEEAPIEVGVDAWNAQISFDALEVTDLERMSALTPGATYSENANTLANRRVTGGGSRVVLVPKPIAVVSEEKGGGFVYAILWKAYNSVGYTLQFKKTDRSKQNMVLKGLSAPLRNDGDRIWRTGVQEAILNIVNTSPLPGVTQDLLITPIQFTGTGGISPYTWAITGGALPVGTSLSAAGLLTGTPDTAGVFNFDITMTDDYGVTHEEAFSWTIAA